MAVRHELVSRANSVDTQLTSPVFVEPYESCGSSRAGKSSWNVSNNHDVDADIEHRYSIFVLAPVAGHIFRLEERPIYV